MKKKIKDLTLEDLSNICDGVGHNCYGDKDCRSCPIKDYCLPPLGTSNRAQPSIMFIKRDLGKEVWWND